MLRTCRACGEPLGDDESSVCDDCASLPVKVNSRTRRGEKPRHSKTPRRRVPEPEAPKE